MPKLKDGSEKQKKFIECYLGDVREAARMAGYRGNETTLQSVGYNLLKKPWIAEAIQKRNEKILIKKLKPFIATRQDRQKFWTETMWDKSKTMKDRLKASELLARSEGDFIDRFSFESSLTVTIIKSGGNVPLISN
jgi:phage terminase small subunit